MKLLVGLGNPGAKHRLNRHNLGFIAVEAWSLLKGEEVNKKDFGALTAKVKGTNGADDVLVMMPQTYMNRSGESVAEAMNFYKLGIEDLVVVHDELDIPPMSFRIKKGGGFAGHNGLRSISPLGENYIRIRMGIGRPPHPDIAVADFVLGNLGKDELAFWEKEMPSVAEAIDLSLAGKMELAMNKFHRKG